MLVGFITSKIGRGIAIVLVVILTLFTTIQFIQKDAQEDIKKDIQIEQLQRDKEVVKNVEDRLNEIDRTTPDANAALERLLERQRDRESD